MFTGPRSTDYMTFTLKSYSGDVYSAQKKGADAARNVCVKHVFNRSGKPYDFSCISKTGLSPTLRPMWG